MHFSVNSKELLKGFETAAPAIGSNPVLPILEDFLLELEDNTLSIRATDLDTTIQTVVNVNQGKEGKTTVNAKTIMNLLKAIPSQPINIKVSEDKQIVLKTSTGEFSLQGGEEGDFPESPEPNDKNVFEIDGDVFRQIAANTLFATSNDDLRPAMTGVNFKIAGKEIVCVATDAHILSRFTIPTADLLDEIGFIVPKKMLSIVSKVKTDTVRLSVGRTNVTATCGDTNVTGRLIDARYPDYNAVIPVDNPLTATFQKNDMIGMLKRLMVVANLTTSQGVFEIKKGKVSVSAQDLDFAKSGNESIPCEFNQDITFKIGFNVKLVLKALSAINAESITLEVSNPSRAGIFRPADGEETDGNKLIVLAMPVMLNN